MNLSHQHRRNIKSIIIFTSIICVGSILNAYMEHGPDFYALLFDFMIGLVFGLVVSITEIYVFEKKFRRLNFTLLLIIRTFFYVFAAAAIIIIIAYTGVGRIADSQIHDELDNQDLGALVQSEDFNEILLYTVVLSFVVNFTRQINRLLGQKVLLNYAAGKYHLPIEEELVIMFLDLKSSTTIAERLGLIKNHRFLNDFFHDMTDSILESKGRIYQYVGDEIVFVWKLKDGIKNLNCINLFWNIKEEIESKKEIYVEKYGVYPEFKAGIHCGKVITGEMGDIKKDIVYHGDTINTASRIQSECNVRSKILLVSGDLLKMLHMDSDYDVENIGSILLKGKEQPLDLYSITKSNG